MGDSKLSIEQLKMECDEKSPEYAWDAIKNNCIKNIDTIEIFFKKPLIGSLAIAMVAYLFASLLYKIKGTPLSKSNSLDKTMGKYITCGSIDTDKLLFTSDPLIGMVKPESYDNHKKNKYGKIFWPWLSPYMYPGKPNRSDDGKLDTKYLTFLPYYMMLKWTTQIYYHVFCAIKNTFYKANHWGSLGEINKINKKLWLSDFFVVFICIPILLFMIMPVIFISIIFSSMLAFGYSMFWGGKNAKEFGYKMDEESTGFAVYKGFVWFLQMIANAFMALVSIPIIMFLHIIWFVTILLGKQETESNGLTTIIKTWANIIWDYKFIWAILAISLWLENFRSYLSGIHAQELGVYQSDGVFSFITRENREMILGTVGGAVVILLIMQQSSYYKELSDKGPKSRDCTAGCETSAMADDKDDKKSSKCLNPTYDRANRFASIPFVSKKMSQSLSKAKTGAADGFKKWVGANDTDNVVEHKKEQERKKKEMAIELQKSTST
jgi:hypothetical protein